MVKKDQALMNQLVQAFHAEAPDHIQTLNHVLLQLERGGEGQHAELLQEAFRAAHSLKGAARAVGVTPIETLAHGVEEVLKQARDKGLRLDPSTCDILYHAFDVIEKLLHGDQADIEPVIEKLSSLGTTEPAGFVASPTPPSEESAVQPVSVESEETIRVAVSKLDMLMAEAGELLTAQISAEQRQTEMQAVRRHVSQFPRLWRDINTLVARPGEDNQRLLDVLRYFEEHLRNLTKEVDHLDSAMNRDVLRLGMVSGRLQNEMRHVRMVPFQTLEPLFQRTVRDAARLEGKQVQLRFEGGDVELDKQVLETLKDAFLHLLRNAVSHGIEMPDARAALNKSSAGEIRVSVIQRGSEAHITVRDDGKGLDLDGLRKAATAQNVPVNDDPNEIIKLAFVPGVTTSEHLTALSGRGVGLDVVRGQVENLQGRIVVESQPGEGAVFQLIVPVSLAMTRVLLTRVGGHCYALPLASVERIVRPQKTFSIEGQTMVSLDSGSMPLVPLATILNVASGDEALAVVMGVAEQRIALLVDDILTEQELAVKPLGNPLMRVRNVVGAALLGSGEPVIVLNAADLVKSARGMRVSRVRENGTQQNHDQLGVERILVVDDSITTRTLEKNILEAAGYEVYTATDGVKALQQLRTHPVALVVADIEMPNMDGIALTRYLRESKEYDEMPVILVTSLESADDRERGMVAGANAYIVKRGFNQAELLATIQRLL